MMAKIVGKMRKEYECETSLHLDTMSRILHCDENTEIKKRVDVRKQSQKKFETANEPQT